MSIHERWKYCEQRQNRNRALRYGWALAASRYFWQYMDALKGAA